MSARRIEIRIFDSNPLVSPAVLTITPRTGRSLDLGKLLQAVAQQHEGTV